MRVNSVFTSLFTHRLVVKPVMTIVMLAILFVASSFTMRSDRDSRAKQANLIIRHIGHRLLTQAGDLTSRVLPVTEIREGTFLLQFENEFVFSHDSLMLLSQTLLPKTQFPAGYSVTVHDCLTGGIVYGFQFNNNSPDLLTCRGRHQPPGCYSIEFTFPDFYDNVEQEIAETEQPAEQLESVKVETPVAKRKRKESKSLKVEPHETKPARAELKSFKVTAPVVNLNTEDSTATTFDYPLINLVYGSVLLLLGVAVLIARFGKRLVPVPMPVRHHTSIKEFVPQLPSLGKFLFDVKDQRLLSGSEEISLTDKECKILDLLNNNFGELIAREMLMQKVWINEGVITGRSLDMFVSKLRKKLSSDPQLRITNVHGKGYKLEISTV